MKLKLGLTPAAPRDTDLQFKSYRTAAPLPTHPDTFGHDDLFPAKGYGMLGNDERGDCAEAGPAHQTMVFNKLAGVEVDFNDQVVLQVYGEITGYDPATGANDNGTDMHALADYWTKTGMLDTEGNRHTIEGVAWLTPGDWNELLEALYLFDSVSIGFQVPRSCMDQFNAGQPWDVVADDGGIEGGHYVPGISIPAVGTVNIVTWASLQGMTQAFYEKYADQVFVPLTKENLTNGKSPEGFLYADLQSDLQRVAS